MSGHYMEGNNDYMIEQQLMKWRMELYAAAQILKGEHKRDFKQLIEEIYDLLESNAINTGVVPKVELDDGKA